MNKLATIWKFKTRQFQIVIDALEDYDIDLSWDGDGKVRAKLERGDLTSFCVRARCYFHDQTLTEDFLDGCIYATPDEFRDHKECGKATRELRAKGDNATIVGSYFADMVANVIKDARSELRVQREKLNGLYLRA